ncbi:MAG TPA: response regulator [Steroidobacteraceae bacterium]
MLSALGRRMQEWNAVDILLAEDDDLDAELTIRVLHNIGVTGKIFRVADGSEALEFVFRDGQFAGRDHALPKLLLLDLNMAKIGGIEVLRELRDHASTKEMPVGILTSSSTHTDFFETQELLVWDYLMKPVSPKDLIDLVERSGLYRSNSTSTHK